MKPVRLSCFFRWLVFVTALWATAAAQTVSGDLYFFSHLAGSLGGPASTDGTGPAARFYYPNGAAVDNAGNLYVADTGNDTVRMVSPTGLVTTLAGKAGTPGSTDGTGPADARFNHPYGVAVDNSGAVFVTDSDNHTIRRISRTGAVSTIAGTAGISGSADGNGATARFLNPAGIAVDSAGNLYVADKGNHTIRKIAPDGTVTTLAGTAGMSGTFDFKNGTGPVARFTDPTGVAVDGAGNVYVADSGSKTIRKITPAGDVMTLAGIVTTVGTSTSVDGPGWTARFSDPIWVAVDRGGNVFVSDGLGTAIRKITPDGNVTTLAGMLYGLGNADGTGAAAQFSYPTGVTVDATGNLFVCDAGFSRTESLNYFFENNCGGKIRKVTATGVVTTVIGSSVVVGSADGSGAAAQFSFPYGVVADGAGAIYVADEGNSTIRKITSAGIVTTVAGVAGQPGTTDGTGSVARFKHPHGLALDGAGNLYVTDMATSHFVGSAGGSVRKITPSGAVTTLVGTGVFLYPYGIAADKAGNVYVADDGEFYFDRLGNIRDGGEGQTIHKISPSGEVTTLAGKAGTHGSADGIGTAARFFQPKGLATDDAGNVYVADSYNQTVRKITPDGTVSTLAGSPGQRGTADGIGTAARFFYPSSLTVDAAGNVFVTDQYMYTLRKITPDGTVTTLGGTAGLIGSADGIGAVAGFNVPTGVTSDKSGNLYIADSYNQTIRKGQLAGVPVIATQPTNQTVATGNDVQLSVIAGGVPAPTYQWYFNGSAFSGATGSTLNFSNARNADAGDYTVVVANSLGSVTSNKATLTVSAASTSTPTPPPASGSGGGGSIEAWFALVLLALGAARTRKSYFRTE